MNMTWGRSIKVLAAGLTVAAGGCGSLEDGLNRMRQAESAEAGPAEADGETGELALVAPEDLKEPVETIVVEVVHQERSDVRFDLKQDYRPGETLGLKKVPVGPYAVQVKLHDGQKVVLEGATEVEVMAGHTAEAVVELGAAGTGGLRIKIIRKGDRRLTDPCTLLRTPIPEMCQVGSWQCSYFDRSKDNDHGVRFTATAACGEVFARRDLYQQACDAKVRIDLDAISCEGVSPEPIPEPVPVPRPEPLPEPLPTPKPGMTDVCQVLRQDIACTMEHAPAVCSVGISPDFGGGATDARPLTMQWFEAKGDNKCLARLALYGDICGGARSRLVSTAELEAMTCKATGIR